MSKLYENLKKQGYGGVEDVMIEIKESIKKKALEFRDITEEKDDFWL